MYIFALVEDSGLTYSGPDPVKHFNFDSLVGLTTKKGRNITDEYNPITAEWVNSFYNFRAKFNE